MPGFISIHWRLEWTSIARYSKHLDDLRETYDDCRRSLAHAIRVRQHRRNDNAAGEEMRVNSTGDVRGRGLRGGDLPGEKEKGGNSSTTEQPAGGRRHGGENPDGGMEKEVMAKKFQKRQRVFLATDISPAGMMSMSMAYTMGENSKKLAVDAIRKLLRELDVVTWPLYEPWFEKVDSGVQGILDKLVAMKAGFFLGAPVECGGGHTYTEEIHAWRAEQKLLSDTWILERD